MKYKWVRYRWPNCPGQLSMASIGKDMLQVFLSLYFHNTYGKASHSSSFLPDTVPPGSANRALTPSFLSSKITVEVYGQIARTAKQINADQSYIST